MHVIQKMDAAITLMQSQGHEVIEIDLTADDYADLMAYAAEISDEGLEGMRLNMREQTYLGHPIVIREELPISGILVVDGAEALPSDYLVERHSRIHA